MIIVIFSVIEFKFDSQRDSNLWPKQRQQAIVCSMNIAFKKNIWIHPKMMITLEVKSPSYLKTVSCEVKDYFAGNPFGFLFAWPPVRAMRRPVSSHTPLWAAMFLLSWGTHLCCIVLFFFLVHPQTSSSCFSLPRFHFLPPRLFPRPGQQEVSTMCLLTGEITQTGRGGRNSPDGQEVDSTVWFSWLGGWREREREEETQRGRDMRQRSREGEWKKEWGEGTGCWACGPNRKALKGLPAIVSTVYQMAFQADPSFKEKKKGQDQTKKNKQESK